MRKMYNKTVLFILLMLVQSCGNHKPVNNEETTVSKISIQIFPVFYTHSLIQCDVTNGEMIFDMIGDVRFIKENFNYDIKPFYHKFSTEDSRLLGDSILGAFEEHDFSDSFLDLEDGINSDILFIYSDGSLL